ncbi:MAG: 3-isopropylmalate dehydratase large subunit [Chloroflexi bacterium]|nr:3-isopropylmalate dehydratase large subunit [Chloroflexota bacterium]
MGMTITEKILATHCGEAAVEPGQYINANVDVVMGHDSFSDSVEFFQELGAEQVFDPDRLVLCPDHHVPNRSIAAANHIKTIRDFARRYSVKNFFEVGKGGICHVIMPEQGLVGPGDLAIAADSHTTTYGAVGAFSTGVGTSELAVVAALGEIWLRVPASIKFVYHGHLPPWVGGKDLILYTIGQIGLDGALYQAMEFTGQAIAELPMEGRFTMCNMAVEVGAKNGIVAPDETTLAYARPRAKRQWAVYQSDADARYAAVYEWDVSKLKPQVAAPHSLENVKSIDEVGEVAIDQAFIGSCTNGRLDDLRQAARVLHGRRVHPNVRLIVIPGSQEVIREALKEGLLEVFIDAGAAVCTPNCGPCGGWHMGLLAAGERCVSTSNRNYKGRMGDPESELYLASPAVAAASAVLGRLASPEEVVSEVRA